MPIVFTEISTESFNLTHEALGASGFNTDVYPSMRTDTYMCTHVHACIHEYTAGEHTGYHAIVSCLKLQLDSTVCFDSDLSSMLILSDKCIFILLRPAAVVVAHDATQRDRKE